MSPHLELFGEDIKGLSRHAALCRDEDSHKARLIVEGAEGCAVVHPLVLVQHSPVQPAVHALPCTVLERVSFAMHKVSLRSLKPCRAGLCACPFDTAVFRMIPILRVFREWCVPEMLFTIIAACLALTIPQGKETDCLMVMPSVLSPCNVQVLRHQTCPILASRQKASRQNHTKQCSIQRITPGSQGGCTG